MTNSGGRAIVACHGELAAGLVSAVTQISGLGGVFLPLSNLGMSGEEIEEVLRRSVGDAPAVIFTDLPAGSWTLAARRLMRNRDDVTLVTGVNLAVLLDFAFHASEGGRSAAENAMEKGRAALAVAGGGGGSSGAD